MSDDTKFSCAQRESNCHLSPLDIGTSKLEISDIGTSDDQDESNCAKQGQQCGAGISEQMFTKRINVDLPAFVRVGIKFRLPLRQRIHFSLGLFDSYSMLDSSNSAPIV